MGFYDAKAKFDSSLINNMGGTGKAFAYLGQSLSDISDAERKKLKDKQDESWKQKLYQDSRTDRNEDVNFRNNNANREQSNFNANMDFKKNQANQEQQNFNANMDFKKNQANQEQQNFNTKFDFQKGQANKSDKIQSDSNVAKVNAMREYLTKQGVDTSKYSNNDLLYAGDTIEKTHLDNTDYKFSQIIYKDKEPYAMYKNTKGETKIQSLFNDGTDGTNSTDTRAINEAKAQKKYEDYLKNKHGQTSTINIDK